MGAHHVHVGGQHGTLQIDLSSLPTTAQCPTGENYTREEAPTPINYHLEKLLQRQSFPHGWETMDVASVQSRAYGLFWDTDLTRQLAFSYSLSQGEEPYYFLK